MDSLPRTCSAEQIGKLIGKSRKAVIRLCRNHAAPGWKRLGRLWEIERETFVHWWSQNKTRIENTSPPALSAIAIDPRPGVVYAIKDPRTNEIRYIGKSGDYRRRKSDHLRIWSGHQKSKHTHLYHWLRSLHKERVKPVFTILQECLPGMMNAVEQEQIAKAKSSGCRLCNANDGGGLGKGMTDATRARLSAVGKAKWQEPEYIANRKANPGGRKVSPEIRARRDAEKLRNRAINDRNMQINAERKRERESFKTLTYLTCKGVAFVPLTQGHRAIIDAEDAPAVSRHVWFANANGNNVRARRKLTQQSVQSLSQFVMMHAGATKVRHRTKSQLDCRKGNLTPCHGTVLQEKDLTIFR